MSITFTDFFSPRLERHGAAHMLALSVLVLAWGSGCDPDPPLTSEGTFFEPVGIGSFEVTREPRILAPARIDLGMLERGELGVKQFQVTNEGRATLDIKNWRLTDDRFEVSFPEFMDRAEPTTLEPGASVLVEVSHRATGQDGVRGSLIIESNDPKNGVLVIDVLANIAEPCLEISDESVDFGSVAPGGERTLGFSLSNCSENARTTFSYLPSLTTDETGFSVLDAASLRERTLEPGEEVEVLVQFTPPSPGEYRDMLRFISDMDGETEHEVLLRGEGTPFGCPTAVIEASHPDRGTTVADPRGRYTGLPLDVVSLDGSASRAEGGAAIERFEWAIIRRPEDSAARLAGSDTSVANELFLDLSGEYTIEMHVWDSRGTRSCEPAVLDLVAVPDEDIHIQLVWDTPNDPEQQDNLGSDVDLHLLRAGGIWNAKPWDCHWQNLEPDWGLRDDRADDPSLDIDDINGWGPENINLNNPQGDMRYHVGVHYFSDQGYGASYSTVRVYLGGILVEELRRKRMTDQQFWHVLDIEWPSRKITLYDDSYLTFPSGVFPPE
jgi:hypothetical protein